MHYVLDLWFAKLFKPRCRGEAYLVRLADDYVACFQYRHDAGRFSGELVERLGKFHLTVAPEKTRLIAFGRYAEERCHGGPETFEFLGFKQFAGGTARDGSP